MTAGDARQCNVGADIAFIYGCNLFKDFGCGVRLALLLKHPHMQEQGINVFCFFLQNQSGLFLGLFGLVCKKIELAQFELGVQILRIKINGSGKFRKCLFRLPGFYIGQGKLIVSAGEFWFCLNGVLVFNDGFLELLFLKIRVRPLHMFGPGLGRVPTT